MGVGSSRLMRDLLRFVEKLSRDEREPKTGAMKATFTWSLETVIPEMSVTGNPESSGACTDARRTGLKNHIVRARETLCVCARV